ncbi:MAG: alpha/beta hydrolase [Solirubrobacterales bacterium]|nr:alpha/beta hydrolase [Solirubrobacterales bacterium]MBV9716797.1 alpha/beta hydrolase [Solirubrobacterales bacterium]
MSFDSPETTRIDVPVAGGSLATFRFEGPRRGLPTVLAVHGMTASSQGWRAVTRALSGRVSVVAPDLRGRGRSNGLPGPYGMAAHARDMLAVLDHLGLERAVLVGHSLGAYIIARAAAEHPDRVAAVVLVDGGLPIPSSRGADPQRFIESFLGPSLARLQMTFGSREDYRTWWRRHPAFAAGDIDDADIVAYADHDVVGKPPALRSSVSEEAVRGDAAELFTMGEPAHRLAVPATLVCAPRGLLDDPNPMQPVELVQAWAAEAPNQRRMLPVPDVNHFTIALGRAGAGAVAATIEEALGVSAAAPTP